MNIKYIALISGFNFFVFSIILIFRKSQTQRDNLILGFLFVIMAAYSILISLYQAAHLNVDYKFLEHYIPINYFLMALMGPFIFFYINSVLNKGKKLSIISTIVHILPLLPSIAYCIYFISLSSNERLHLSTLCFNKGWWFLDVLFVVFYLQMTIYLYYSYIQIQKQLNISTYLEKQDAQFNIAWLKPLLIVDLLFMVFSGPLCFYFDYERVTIVVFQLAIVFQLIYFFISSTWQTGFFPVVNLSESFFKQKELIQKMPNGQTEDYLKMLIDFMEVEKIYLRENCNIQLISEQTGISVHHLSSILNQGLFKSFPDFINEYRIEEAKKLLHSPQAQKMTLEAIGFQCGFGSKSSFNKTFKKVTNFTPTEYRQQGNW